MYFSKSQTKQLTDLIPVSPDQFVTTIESIATGTPDHIVPQAEAAKFVAKLRCLEKNQHRIEKIYQNTRIETRHLAVNLLTDETVEFTRESGTIAKRMQMYEEYALPLAEKVAKKALAKATQNQVNSNYCGSEKIEDSLGLIVFVTSTGFVAPGIDAKLIQRLGLKRNIARIPVHFMGCAAAMNGLRVASDYVKANLYQKALVICLELSSVNAAFEDKINDVIIHSIFGDGCAAVVIGSHQQEHIKGQGQFVIKDNFSYLVEDTEDGITLGVNDNGITCLLSRQLPDYIESGVGPIIRDFLASHNLTQENIDLWAVHPGGTKIIEKVMLSLGLNDEQVTDSWEVLRQYGNILSCAILFVIERMMLRIEEQSLASVKENLGCVNGNGQNSNHESKTMTGISFSFAPGVGIEGILFARI